MPEDACRFFYTCQHRGANFVTNRVIAVCIALMGRCRVRLFRGSKELTRSIATYAKLVTDASEPRQTQETPVSTAFLVHSYFLTSFSERLPMYREPPARRQTGYAVRLSMSLFKIQVTSADFKKRPTDRHFCTIGTTNAVLDYSLCGSDILAYC
jgi:hypothetical protein